MSIEEVGTSTRRYGECSLVLGSENVPLLLLPRDSSPDWHVYQTHDTFVGVAYSLRADRRRLCCCLEASIVVPYARDLLIW